MGKAAEALLPINGAECFGDHVRSGQAESLGSERYMFKVGHGGRRQLLLSTTQHHPCSHPLWSPYTSFGHFPSPFPPSMKELESVSSFCSVYLPPPSAESWYSSFKSCPVQDFMPNDTAQEIRDTDTTNEVFQIWVSLYSDATPPIY